MMRQILSSVTGLATSWLDSKAQEKSEASNVLAQMLTSQCLPPIERNDGGKYFGVIFNPAAW